LEKLVTPKPIPLLIPEIGVGAKVTLIDIVTHAYEVFKTLDMVLKDTPIAKNLRSVLLPLVELVDTIGEQLVDDLITRVK
jgi:hypothetical protein